jgi:hypothetical protein
MILADTYSLALNPQAVVPALLSLDLYFWDEDPLTPLARQTRQGEALPSVTVTVGRAVPRQPLAASPEHDLSAEFEHGIKLIGYDVSAEGALYLTLYWRLDSDEPVPGDYTVFVHLVDKQGIPIVQPADSPPLDGDWPTSAWQPGHTVADTRLVALPPDLHAGRYDVRVGLYDPATGVRLMAWQPDGTPWPEAAVVLEDVVVK